MINYLHLVAVSVCAVLLAITPVVGAPAAQHTMPVRTSGSFLKSHRLDLLEVDCSGSFRAVSKTFIPQMITIAENSAEQHRALWAGCFDGAPVRNLVWNPQVDFGDLPPSISSNPTLVSRFNLARAIGLKPQLAHMIETTPTRTPGSGQLEALELAAQTQDVGRVFMFTDAAINEVGGLNLITANAKQIERTIKTWAPRMTGLRGVQLMFIGVGRDVHFTASVRNAEKLFDGLAKAVGASITWTQSLPLNFAG
jgi:hypothetical protein